MNKIIVSALLLSGMAVNAQQQQVGINTAEPKATLHVEAGASENKGVIIPRITAAEMKTMTAGLGADHHSMMTYLKEQMPTADRTGKLVDVAEPGYYFYDNTTGVQKWKALGGEQDLRMVGTTGHPGSYNHLTKDAGIGGNGTSLGEGDGNIGIGKYTFNGFTNNSDLTGRINIALGRQTYNFQNGAATMSGNSNTGIGEILYDFQNGGSMQGGRNIAMGDGIYTFQKTNAQFSNTASSNMGIGSSLFNLRNGDLTGSNNIGLGLGLYYLASGNMAGESNIGIGTYSYSMRNGDITATSNIALGHKIYRLNKTSTSSISGSSNIGIGGNLYVLESGSITGHKNIGVGDYVFNLSSGELSGNENIGIGVNTMWGLSAGITGNSNIGIGSNSITSYGGITGNHNIALGSEAMHSGHKIAGTDNIAIGRGALNSGSSHDIGSYNIGVGYQALIDGMGKGNANIHIGNKYVGTPVTGQLNQVVAIGNEINGLTSSNTDSNVILLGKTGSNAPKVGIGTYKPGAKLEVNTGSTAGAVKIVDGTQGAGKVLTSDVNGLATWKEQRLVMIQGVKGSGVTIPVNGGTYIYTGSYITLPPGKYMVTVQNLMTTVSAYSDGHIWLRSTFSDSRTTFSRTSDIPSTGGNLISGLLPKGALFSMINGSVIINNTGTSPKTYYYWAGDVFGTPGTSTPLRDFGSHSEWSMTAIPIQ